MIEEKSNFRWLHVNFHGLPNKVVALAFGGRGQAEWLVVID